MIKVCFIQMACGLPFSVVSELQLEEFGGALVYVTEFLEHEAKAKNWKAQEEAGRQYRLF